MTIQDESRIESLTRTVNDAYRQRSTLAVAFVKMAILQGWPAGRGLDDKEENDMEWRHVVYVDLPGGQQVSWHMAPDEVKLLDGMPEYAGTWNGTFVAKESEWVSLLNAPPVESLAELRSRLSGFAMKRWDIECTRLHVDPDVSDAARDAILRGYAKAWANKV